MQTDQGSLSALRQRSEASPGRAVSTHPRLRFTLVLCGALCEQANNVHIIVRLTTHIIHYYNASMAQIRAQEMLAI